MKWKRINGYAKYSISDTGIVKNNQKSKECKQTLTPKKYRNVYIYQNGKEKRMAVHRLVATAFIPNVSNKIKVRHINGDKEDNRAVNLEWY